MDNGGDESSFGFLTHKIGPMPVWMWGALIVGAYYWYKNYGPGATAATTTGTTTVVQSGGQSASGPYYTGSQYTTNGQWEAAAINYLVGESIPPDQASMAIYNYLHSKTLTAQEQKDVNLAIEGVGTPPKVPAPAQVTKPKPHKHPHKHPKRPPSPRGKPPTRHMHPPHINRRKIKNPVRKG